MAASDITVRRVSFDFPDALDPVVAPGQPEESFANVGMSLLLPHLEPYLIRSMTAARPQIDDPDLLRDLDAFNAQEGQHFRQHIRFNKALHLAGFEALVPLEEELAEDYRRFTRERSLRWNLAYAEGFEAMTMALARYALENGALERLRPEVRDLFEWHLIEELEHRTVAFDVYQRVCGGWVYRLFVGLYAQWHLSRFVARASKILRGDEARFRERFGGGWSTWRRARPHLKTLLLQFLPKLLASYLPWYSPHRIAMPDVARERSTRYTALAEAARAAKAKPGGAEPEAAAAT